MKNIFLALLLLGTLLFSQETKIDLRAVYINYEYDKGFPDAETFATSVKLKYEKEFLENISFGIAFGTVQDLGILDYDKSERKRNMAYIFDKDKENFSILHQAYLKYELSDTLIRLGRFELETPLISSDDYFVLSNSFEGFDIDISEIENFKFKLGYIDKMSGAWDSAYDGSSFESMTKQAWAHRGDTGSESYYNLVDDLGVKDSGTGYIGIEVKNENTDLKVYDHLFLDAYNSLFAQIDYKTNNLLLAGQYINYDGVGALKNNPNPEAKVDYYTYSAKAELNFKNYAVKLAYTGVSDTPSLHFFGTAGGFPEFATGLMVGYFETSLRDANIFSITPSFNFSNIKLKFVYSYYDLNSNYTKGGIIGNNIEGDAYLHTYGVSTKYTYNGFSILANLAQRKLEHGDENMLFRTVVGYTF